MPQSFCAMRTAMSASTYSRIFPLSCASGSLMIFNDTKVVPARLHFQRETGAHIEIFCLEPVNPPEYNTAFAATERCRWKCVIGNAKRWKNDVLSLYNPDSDEAISAMGLKRQPCRA